MVTSAWRELAWRIEDANREGAETTIGETNEDTVQEV